MKAIAPWTTLAPLDSRPCLSATGANYVCHKNESWKLDRLWTFHLFGKQVRWTSDGRSMLLKRGQAVLAPPNVNQQYDCIESKGSQPYWYWAHFWFTEGTSQTITTLPMIVDFEIRAKSIERTFEQMMHNNSDDVNRAEVQLWELLHSLKDALPTHPIMDMDNRQEVAKAAMMIEKNLSNPPSVPEIAAQVGISQSHLTRLFRKRFRTTLIGYIRRCRLQRAEHMLRFSDMPIKVIAVDIGIRDLQQFNKFIRQEFKMSPRDVRLWEKQLRKQRREREK